MLVTTQKFHGAAERALDLYLYLKPARRTGRESGAG
jgi:hypothetical protein